MIADETLMKRVDEKISQLGGKAEAIKGLTLNIDLKQDGVYHLNFCDHPPSFTFGEQQAECTLHIGIDNFIKMLDRDLNPMLAYTVGKLSVTGDIGQAMKLATLFE